MKKNILIFVAIVLGILVLIQIVLSKKEYFNLQLVELRKEYIIKDKQAVDHSKFEVLQKEFTTPQEVTLACLSCHNKRHEEVMSSSHWNWERANYEEGNGVSFLGKKNILNNFCIGTISNEAACMACHIGFGMTDDKFDFKNAANVDCMVCHDNSNEYLKGSGMAGYPDRSVNLNKVAQSVGNPTNTNCGVCHFYGGGGNNVKHGDIESATIGCSREIDVHMAANGIELKCTDCHVTHNHQITGRLYSVSSENSNRVTCEQCHTNTPHLEDITNRHTSKVACQTCHIPTYAKANATKMGWYWAEAGKMDENSKPIITKDSLGNTTYDAKKGRFVWKQNVRPDYIWFNGTAEHFTIHDTIRTDTLYINRLHGSYTDENAKIVPVKIHKGDQIYDAKYKTLIQPKLYSLEKGDSGFWKNFDWNLAAEAGMKRAGLPFSGEYAFISTIMYWPINHMVAPKEKTMSCAECHTRENSVIASLDDFYLPGRDYISFVDISGTLLIIFSLLGVAFHSILRIINNRKNNK